MIIIRRWGSGDDVVNGVWDIPRFEDIPLGSTKVPSSGLLGLVTSGLFKPPKGDFFCFSRVSSPLLLNVPQADPFFLFVCS